MPDNAENALPEHEITVFVVGLTEVEFQEMFERVAEAAHRLDQQVTCSGGKVPEPRTSPGERE